MSLLNEEFQPHAHSQLGFIACHFSSKNRGLFHGGPTAPPHSSPSWPWHNKQRFQEPKKKKLGGGGKQLSWCQADAWSKVNTT